MYILKENQSIQFYKQPIIFSCQNSTRVWNQFNF